MAHHLRRLAPLTLAAVALIAAPASAADREVSVDATTTKTSWTGTKATGYNFSFFLGATTGSICDKTERYYCDSTVVTIGEGQKVGTKTPSLRVDMTDIGNNDFDLRVYTATATGAKGTFQGNPTSYNSETSPLGSEDPRNTWVGDNEYKVITNVKQGQKYYVEIVYFTVVDSTYKATVEVKDFHPLPPPVAG